LGLGQARTAQILRRLDVGQLERLLSRSRSRALRAQEVLIDEGQRGDALFLVLTGTLVVRRFIGDHGDSAVVAVRRAGEWVGEGALLSYRRRSASVTAEEPSRVLEVPRDAFLAAISTRPAAVQDLVEVFVARQRESDARWIDEVERKSRRLLVSNRRLRSENQRLRSALDEQDAFSAFVGRSPAASSVRDSARRAAASDLPVLLVGETGTGKGMLARAIHAGSAHAGGPFLPVRSAWPGGGVPGAETRDHHGAGAGDAPSGGSTLFLEEVADLESALQERILGIVREGEHDATTGPGSRMRVIASTSADLDALLRTGRLRRDLFHRLDVIRIVVPPLRERREDVAALLAHFNHATARRLNRIPLVFSPEALDALSAYDYPGNVRELANEVERLFAALPPYASVGRAQLSPHIADFLAADRHGYQAALRSYKVRLLRAALEEAGGSTTRAAEALGLHRSNLVRMMRTLGIRLSNDSANSDPED
jgi:DNA-binding NtrC family response regulator